MLSLNSFLINSLDISHLGDKATTKDLLEIVVRASGPVSISVGMPIRIAGGMIAVCMAIRATSRVAVMVMVYRTIQVTIAAGLLHLLVGRAPDGRVVRLEALARVAGAHGGEEVDVEGEDVKGEDEGDGPLEHGSCVGGLFEVAGCEGDGEDHLDDDEGELDPERDAEDSVVCIVWIFTSLV